MLGCPHLGSHHAHLGKLITAGHVLPEAGRYLVAIEWRHVERTDQDDGVEHGADPNARLPGAKHLFVAAGAAGVHQKEKAKAQKPQAKQSA